MDLSSSLWFHLYCLGPNCQGLGLCDTSGGQKASYTALLKIIGRAARGLEHVPWDVLMAGVPEEDLDMARVSLGARVRGRHIQTADSILVGWGFVSNIWSYLTVFVSVYF